MKLQLFLLSIFVMPAALAQEPNKGWIEGTVATEQGAATFVCGEAAVSVTAKPRSGTGFKTGADAALGGFYTLREIPPGVYEIFVSGSTTSVCSGEPVSPVHILGVVVKPGTRTVLNVVLHKGQTLEELGSPAITQPLSSTSSPSIASIVQRLDDLQKQIDDLRAELKKK